MKQIKTIKNRLDNVVSFDKEVNAALAEGWTLTKREVLLPRAQTSTQYTYIMVYAELELEVITEAERCCENCLHYDKDPSVEPCFSCSETASEWEPMQ